jgi:hypothetical protein
MACIGTSRGMSALALFFLDQQGQIRFSQAYPDVFNTGVDDLHTLPPWVARLVCERNEPRA